jgi:putative ABC transport system ATP-binding protein
MNTTPLTSPDSIIEIHDLEFQYTPGKPVLKIERLKINRGERIFIYGPSGSGKTTLLGLLAGVLPPQKGSIEILGEKLEKMSGSARDHFRGNHLGYIFQMFNLIPYLSVEENIRLSAELNPLRAKKVKGHESSSALAIAKALGIEDFLNRKVTELSVGQQQRVAAARALYGSPEIIIADEPTSALDYDHRERFLELLFSECEKTNATVLFVSHDRQLEKLFDRCLSLAEMNIA